jgi:hypothetical protein
LVVAQVLGLGTLGCSLFGVSPIPPSISEYSVSLLF